MAFDIQWRLIVLWPEIRIYFSIWILNPKKGGISTERLYTWGAVYYSFTAITGTMFSFSSSGHFPISRIRNLHQHMHSMHFPETRFMCPNWDWTRKFEAKRDLEIYINVMHRNHVAFSSSKAFLRLSTGDKLETESRLDFHLTLEHSTNEIWTFCSCCSVSNVSKIVRLHHCIAWSLQEVQLSYRFHRIVSVVMY